ncbi:hypothetical protein PRIPAC_75894 [Pristionchus pacificus]|uniref:Uncharacterized protein n=1 Tax=Pristionchus pacificus TaxID=54126 RepID=A0A2A6C077_PRIPA|nr:hypothetical protein PRIPAC_75894 [Pristionchus pacificus]|eukprot:PDM71538.1 hypothetical protein PRIPAC_37945 [Pristionchus pacificus]
MPRALSSLVLDSLGQLNPINVVRRIASVGLLEICVMAALAKDAYEIGGAIKQDFKAGTRHETVHTAAAVMGSWAGIMSGTMCGVVIGRRMPDVGGLLGGLGGCIAGAYSGRFIARKVARALMPALEDTKKLAMSQSLPLILLKTIWDPQFLRSARLLSKGLWKANIILGIATDVRHLNSALRKDHANGTKHHTIHMIAEAVAAWGLLVPCSTLGASLGSKISETGAVIGGLIGGILGSQYGGVAAYLIANQIWPVPMEEIMKERVRFSLSLNDQDGKVEENTEGAASMEEVMGAVQATLEHFSPENIAARKAEAENKEV